MNRLIPSLGPDGALAVARAMMTDTIRRCALTREFVHSILARCCSFAREFPTSWRRIVYFAPSNREAELQSILQDADAESAWERQPMRAHSGDLRNADLGSILRAGYEVIRDNIRPTIFIGMDTPDLPAKAVAAAAIAAHTTAVIHDSTDGGYVLAALPPTCPPEVFDRVEWSTERTADSQRARLRECGVPVSAAEFPPWDDIDEIDDVWRLARRLVSTPGLCTSLEQLLPLLPR